MNNNNNNIDEQFEQQVERTITQYEKDFNNDVDFEAGKLTKEMEKAKLTADVDTSNIGRDFADLLRRMDNNGQHSPSHFSFTPVRKMTKVNKKINLMPTVAANPFQTASEGLVIVNAAQVHHLAHGTLQVREYAVRCYCSWMI